MKNSTHPLRLFDSRNWETKNTFGRLFATTTVHVYNIYLMLLSLAMIGYSGYLINKHNSPFASLLMGISCYMFLTSAFGLIAPYVIPSRVAAPIWWAMNGLLGLFCLGLFITSFFPAFFETPIKMDAGAVSRKNAGLDFVKWGRDAFKFFTIAGFALSLLSSGALGWLYNDWNKHHVEKDARAYNNNNLAVAPAPRGAAVRDYNNRNNNNNVRNNPGDRHIEIQNPVHSY